MYNIADFQKQNNNKENKFNYTKAGALGLGGASALSGGLRMNKGIKNYNNEIKNNKKILTDLLNEPDENIVKNSDYLKNQPDNVTRNHLTESRRNNESFEDFQKRIRKYNRPLGTAFTLGVGLIGTGVGAGLGYGAGKIRDLIKNNNV